MPRQCQGSARGPQNGEPMGVRTPPAEARKADATGTVSRTGQTAGPGDRDADPAEGQDGDGRDAPTASRVRLDDRAVAALTCPPGRKDRLVMDAGTRGFGVRVEASGRRTFVLKYKIGGLSRRLPLGAFGDLTTAQARRLAQQHRGAVLAGRDPWGEARAARATAAEAEVAARRKSTADAFTVRRLIEAWDRLHLAHKRPSYRRDALSRMNGHLTPILGTPAAEVTRREAVACVDKAAEGAGETTARRVQSYARAMFGWAAGRDMVKGNPFEGVPTPGRDVPRERVLTPAEVGMVWRAAGTLAHPYGPFVRFLLLTMQRREEVVGLRWGEVAADLSAWTLPGARAKNGKPHVVHLSPPARAVLEETGRPTGREADAALVFGTLDGRALTTFSWVKRGLDAAIRREREGAAARAGLDAPAPLVGWTFHDFRRSGVTWLAEAGFPPHVADRLLNHVAGTIRGVAAICQRGDFLPEREAALTAWGAHVEACGRGEAGAVAPANVVPLPARRRRA